MKRIYTKWGVMALCAASLTTLLNGRASAQFTTTPLRVLTLGDSITAMYKYQPHLRTKLSNEGVTATFVGSQGSSPNQHEGHSGWSIGQINDNVNTYLTNSNANVVLLQIGINNMNHGLGMTGKSFPPYQDNVQAQAAQPGKTLNELGATWGDSTYGSGYLTQQVSQLLDKILNHANAPTLIVAKIPGVGLGNPNWQSENNDADARVKEYNGILEAAVKTRQDSGKKIRIVDNYALGNRAYGTGSAYTWGDSSQQSGDWVHPRPDAAAWEGMATNFFNGMKAAFGGSTTPTPTPTPNTSGKYEAEQASLSAGAKTNTDHTGYSGTGFVDGYWLSGATTTFTVNAASAGSQSVTLRYANATGTAKTLSVYVNGAKVTQMSLPSLANWDTWGDKSESLSLNAGNNTIAYKYDSTDSGNVNLDYIAVSAATTPTNLVSNPSFDAEAYDTQTPSGWSEWEGDANNNTIAATSSFTETYGGAKSGARHGTHYKSAPYRVYTYQTKTGLTNGLYTLRAYVRRSGSQTTCYMEAADYGSTSKTANIPVSSTYQLIEIKDINVTNGQCKIGFWSVGGTHDWIHFDDVSLTKQ